MKGERLVLGGLMEWEDFGRSVLLLNPRMEAGWQERVLAAEFPDLEDHVWMATSGTGGRLKVVALSRQALEASAVAVNRHLAATHEDVWLNPLPLFHVGGLGIVVRAAMSGVKWERFDVWSAEGYGQRVKEVRATLSSLVPTQVFDLVSAGIVAPKSLRAVVVGGGALDEGLRRKAARLGWPLLRSYGLTEMCSQVATARIGREEDEAMPLLEHVKARVDGDGRLCLRGASLLSGWMVFEEKGSCKWEDPKVDGELLTGDRAELVGESVRVLGRMDDLVKIRGELVDVGALERALQMRVGNEEVMLEVREDERNGSELSVVVGREAEREAVRRTMDLFPPYARPVDIRVGEIKRTPLGKIVREG